MGRSLGGKMRLSPSYSEAGGGNGDETVQHHHHPQAPNPSNVRLLIEKLRSLKPHNHEDIMKLESVKAVLSALEESPCAGYIPPSNDISEDDVSRKCENLVSPSSSLQSSSLPQASKSIRSPKFTASRTSGNKGQKYKACGGTEPSDTIITGQPSTSTANDKLMTAKKGCATLIQNFENLYKKVAKKYFFMLKPKKPSKSNFFGVFFSILAFIFYFELHTISGFSRLWLKWENVDLSSVECTIESPNVAMELFRPPVSCSICHNVRSADRVSSISPAEFERVYAYTGRPVVVTDGMTNWSAPSAFAFEFFKGIYSEGSRSLVHLDEDCLFFPYQTEFRNLAEVFNMTKERSGRPWYIGWSNCDAETSHILRQHYQRPYFLPETAESTHADWIFMGTPGFGAHMHIDHVINPSWQGQIKGFKRWHLQPPPECLYECHSFHVDVHPGDIIVLDTNKWYHQTEILPGENSITIGSEYD